MTTADVGSTRRVSLVREDKSDLQIVALERCDSFSSTSSDYEEIDLNAPTDVAIVEDKRTFPDSDETDNDSDVDNADSEDKCLSDSNGEEVETFETVRGGEEEDDERENSVEGYYGDPAEDDNASNDDDDDDDDVVENAKIMSDDNDIENNMADDDGDDDDDVVENVQIVSDDDDVENNLVDDDGDDDDHEDGDHVVGDDIDVDDIGNSDALSEDNDNQNNNDLSDDRDVENASDEGAGDDIGQNFPDNSEILEDDLLDSDNEINILNDISITIANESLTTNKADEHLEFVDDEEQENIGQIGRESGCEQLNDENLISPQRIIVSRSDSEDENDSKDRNETKMLVEHHTVKSKLLVADKKDKDSPVSSLTASSETAKTDLLTKEEKSVQNVKKTTNDVKASTIAVKRNSKVSTVVKPELATTCTSKLEKESSHKIMPKEKTVEKAKEIGNEKEKARIANKSTSNKASGKDGKVAVASEEETKVSSVQGEDEEEMDFDQLSIEDEDSDFVEEEENLPVVKSKVGLNKIPTERSRVRTRRSSSRENRKRRRSYSPGRFRTSSHSYRNRSSSRDRLRSNRLRDRSRETYRRRSLSPQSRERRHRGSYSRGEKGLSRDRTQNRNTTSVVSKNRENRRYRSRSRSGSRTKTGRTEKDLKSKNHVAKQTAKDSMKASVKERLEIKKEGNAKSSSLPRKELNTQDNVANKKAVKVKESKSSTVVLVANGAKVESSSTTIKATKMKVKQTNGWYRHVKNVYSKAFQIG